jgi:predicted  nucleic acid-binding Zn-ribbon protein
MNNELNQLEDKVNLLIKKYALCNKELQAIKQKYATAQDKIVQYQEQLKAIQENSLSVSITSSNTVNANEQVQKQIDLLIQEIDKIIASID